MQMMAILSGQVESGAGREARIGGQICNSSHTTICLFLLLLLGNLRNIKTSKSLILRNENNKDRMKNASPKRASKMLTMFYYSTFGVKFCLQGERIFFPRTETPKEARCIWQLACRVVFSRPAVKLINAGLAWVIGYRRNLSARCSWNYARESGGELKFANQFPLVEIRTSSIR